jgi:splicing factor 3B subunit 3
VHRTVVQGGLPAAVCAFQGRLLVGLGRVLRLYDLGKRKLLRKCENKHIPNQITHITSVGPRVVVCDQKESFFFVKYQAGDNILSVFCDDTNPRWATTACMLDYQTVCGADKFGNIVVARLPTDASDDIAEDPTGAKAFWSRGILNGAPQKLDVLNNFYVGETVQSLHKLVLRAGGKEAIAYTTMGGSVGVLVPFLTKEEFEFFQTLEMHLRQEHPPLCGRDHLAYRSYHFPCKVRRCVAMGGGGGY